MTVWLLVSIARDIAVLRYLVPARTGCSAGLVWSARVLLCRRCAWHTLTGCLCVHRNHGCSDWSRRSWSCRGRGFAGRFCCRRELDLHFQRSCWLLHLCWVRRWVLLIYVVSLGCLGFISTLDGTQGQANGFYCVGYEGCDGSLQYFGFWFHGAECRVFINMRSTMLPSFIIFFNQKRRETLL